MKLLDIVNAKANDNFTLLLTFENGEKRRFDFSPYLSRKPFAPLCEPTLFRQVAVKYGTVTWLGGSIDFDPETLYEESTAVGKMDDIIAYDRAKKKDDGTRFSFEEVEERITRKPKLATR